MSISGTAKHLSLSGLPELVERAVHLAAEAGFDKSCLPEHGRLLAILSAGRNGGVIGETGTGCGVGLAWMVSAASSNTRFVSVELDHDRATVAAELFADRPNVSVVEGDWSVLKDHGPFDLLVLDGGGAGKGDEPIEPSGWLRPAGALVIDDFTPNGDWPRTYGGAIDAARMHWLQHPEMVATEIQTTHKWCTLVAIRR